MQLARKRDIRGRSTMRKAELIEALSRLNADAPPP